MTTSCVPAWPLACPASRRMCNASGPGELAQATLRPQDEHEKPERIEGSEVCIEGTIEEKGGMYFGRKKNTKEWRVS